jgi:solute carrier family 13 (sodium-dependent dicarboxylate transporter), member 2/3/5
MAASMMLRSEKRNPARRRHPRQARGGDGQRKRMTTDIGAAAPALAPEQAAQRYLEISSQILCVLVPLAIWFMPVDIEPTTKHGLAIAMFMVVAWITKAMDYTVTGFIGCFLFWALGIVGFNVAFSGFANDTAWFLFSALLLGVIATHSGVARRLAYVVMLRIGSTYPRILLGLIVTDFLLTFIVPSGVARLVIMAAIAPGLVEAFRAQTGSNVARGMFLILTYTANIFDKTIIAGAGSITARGLIEKVGGVEVLWSAWFLAFLPCSIITVLVAWRLTLWMYPPEVVSLEGGRDYLLDELKKMGPWSSLEKKAALLLGAAVTLWLTDFIHHISPAVIGMGVGLFALLPHVGILEAEDLRKLNYMPVFFVAAAVSMGSVLEATKGIDLLTHLVFTSIQPYLTSLLATTVIMYWAGFVYHFFLASEICSPHRFRWW